MASTRDKNTIGNFKLEERGNLAQITYNTNNIYSIPTKSFHPGNGLLPAKTSRDAMTFNACDIESRLFGIGSNNLVKSIVEIQPEFKDVDSNLRDLKSLSIIDRTKLIMPEPLKISNTERYLF
jgi:hypothetical protein